jgi:hypothetical protein
VPTALISAKKPPPKKKKNVELVRDRLFFSSSPSAQHATRGRTDSNLLAIGSFSLSAETIVMRTGHKMDGSWAVRWEARVYLPSSFLIFQNTYFLSLEKISNLFHLRFYF